MQFPKAARFVAAPPSGVPGPGSYNPHSPPQHDKKGLIGVTQADRFEKQQTKQSTFGMYSEPDKENNPPTARKRIASTSTGTDRERHRQQLEELKTRMTAHHEKELAKLEAKISKLETHREELSRDKHDSHKEVAGLKSEIRHLSSKLTKTESLLEKHQTTLPLLQSKLTSLQTSHEQSRQRKESELATLRTQLEHLERTFADKSCECREMEQAWQQERHARTLEADVARQVVEDLHERVRHARLVDLVQERHERNKLERQVQDRQAEIATLVDYSKGLESTVILLEGQVRSALADNAEALSSWRVDRDLLVSERNEKEWRQRARSDLRELIGLTEELEAARAEAHILQGVDQTADSVWKLRKREWKDNKERLEADHARLEAELDTAVNEDIPRLEAERASLSSRLEEQVAHRTNLETDLTALAQESAESQLRLEGEIEEQKRVVEVKEKEIEKERVERKRIVGILLQSRAAETALREQVDELSEQNRVLAPLEAQHSSLQQTIDHLARLNAATEHDLHDLIGQNAELAGHSNQNQKIKHVVSLREELNESKRKHRSTVSLLTTAQNKVKELERELDSFRAVPSSAFASTRLGPAAGRSRVSRPNIEDVQAPTPFQVLQQQQQQQQQQQARSQSIPTIVQTTSSALPEAPPIPRASNRPHQFRASINPTTTMSTLTEDEPLLPPILAKTASSFLSNPPTGKDGLVVRDARRRTSGLGSSGISTRSLTVNAAERMEGRMSVSELFN
ncbi:uncharacterized protein JCM15063_005076 [Sporobolomyces koalae]|uniref:uncharacterized protein n=1 Tax=Sporobolomyces koalae TaxID=500713 RepID=UPI00316EBD70